MQKLEAEMYRVDLLVLLLNLSGNASGILRPLQPLQQRPQDLMTDIPDLKRNRRQLPQLPDLHQVTGHVILRVLLVIVLPLARLKRRVSRVRPPKHVRISELSDYSFAQFRVSLLVR